MKKQNLLTRMLLLCALIVGSTSVWADKTATWSGTNMVKSGTPGTSYAEYTSADNIVDDEGNKYVGRWTYQKYNNNYLQMVQLKKAESSNSSRILLPKFDGNIKSVTITATNASANTSSGTGAKTTLNLVKGTTYTATFAKTAANIVATDGSSSSEKKQYVFDLSKKTETGDGLYICSIDAAIRIWSIVVVYAEPAVDPTSITFKVGETTMTADGSTKNDLGNVASASLTLTPDQTADVYYTTDGSEPTTSSTKYSSAITITNPCTIWAFAKNSAGDGVKAKALFKFSRANGLAFGSSEYTAYLADGTFSTALTNPNTLDVTYSSTDETVATVATDGTVTLKAAGETTIKATFAGDDTYAAGAAQYTLTVSNKSAAGISYASDFIHIEEPTYNTEISAPITLTNPNSVAVTYASSDATVATVNATTGAVTPKKVGTTTITASFAGDATYEAAEVSYTLKLGLQDAGLAFDDASHEITYTAGATYTMGFTKATDAAATFSSSNTNVATVNATTGEVTVVSVGTTTITATAAKTSDYKAGEAEYTLTVTENASAPTISASTTILNETFDTNNETGGNDGTWSGISTTPKPSFDLTGWTYSTAYAGKTCVRTGKSGSITTPALGVEGNVTLTFKMAAWGNDTNNGYVDILNGGTFDDGTSSQKQVTIKKSEWDTFELELLDVTEETKIKFSDNGNSKRLFIDEVKVLQSATPTVSYTVPTSGWGTFCSPYKLDLDNDATEITAYAVTGFDASAGTITFKKATGVVPAKTPLVIKGEAGAKKIAVDQTAATGTAPAGNLLTGYLSPTYYDGDRTTNTVFGMSNGNFHKMKAGNIPANRAVLSMSTTEADKVGASEGRFTFIFDDETTTGIGSLTPAPSPKGEGSVYTLSGQKVQQPKKGLYIVNGKKVLVK